MTKLVVGSRISSDGYIGTVRFIGTVPKTNGEWVGVEWDDPARGKHDGTKDGIRYFACKHSTGGSFVRPHKLNLGISVCDAIKERYTVSQDTNDTAADVDLFLALDKGYKKVETVGMDKAQRQFEKLHELQQVGLRDQLISISGEKNLLSSLTPQIVELDLSKNLLSSWETVHDIAIQLPLLKTLNLSENILLESENLLEMAPAFSSIHTLIMNKCRLTWPMVLTYSVMWPDIKRLHLSFNDIFEITSPPNHMFTKLEFLTLSENNIELSWNSINKLGLLPQLSTLLLDDCGLSEIIICPGSFQRLLHISLVNNNFKDLVVFNELNKLPALESLTMKKNPVLDLEDSNTMRGIVVAKIRKLIMFNHSKVEEMERMGSELDYLKKYGMEWKTSGGDQDPEKNNPSEEFLKKYPRFMEICRKYGSPADNEFIKKTSAIKGNLIEVMIEIPTDSNFKPIKRRLPLSMTIGNLKLFLQKLTKTEIRKQRLVYVSKNDSELVVSLDRDHETLHDVSIEPFDIIQVLELREWKFNPRRQWARIIYSKSQKA